MYVKLKTLIVIKLYKIHMLNEINLKRKKPNVMLKLFWSGWQDSNLRPPRPKRGAITGLRYTPN